MSGRKDPLSPGKRNTGSSSAGFLRQLDPEEAETQNVAHLESIGSNVSSERPSQSQAHLAHLHTLFATEQPSSTKPSFKRVARQVLLMQKLQQQKSSRNLQATGPSSPTRGHRKNKSTAADLLDQIVSTDEGEEEGDQVHHAVFHSAGISVSEEGDEDEESNQDLDEEEDDHSGESLPLVMTDSPDYSACRVHPTMPRTTRAKVPLWKRLCLRGSNCCADPTYLAQRFYHVLAASYLVNLAMPLFALAWILYYGAGNPEWEFIPGSARSAWLLNFTGRQIVTLELARLSQWLILDCLVLGSRYVALWMGPLVTMTALQSQGWPFVVVLWACWDLLLLHGDSPFRSHWLFWTGWKFYTQSNSGQYILTSEAYFRVLCAMIVAGIVTTAKRMFLTVRFGRRMLGDFRPRLEKLLADIVLVGEIADLAVEAGKLEDSSSDDGNEETNHNSEEKSNKDSVVPPKDQQVLNIPKIVPPRGSLWTSVRFDKEDDDDEKNEGKDIPDASNVTRETSTQSSGSERPHLTRSPSGSVLLKSMLEKWDEPQGKLKSGDATIQDVLKFKHALNYMDDKNPFGDSFGLATDRNECIASSHKIYYKLLKCTPGAKTVPFEVLAWITADEKDVQDDAKLKALRRLFQPDANGNLTLLAFVQSCDTVYKRLRYFKASVSNASVIDIELEKILNCLYWFVLVLILLGIMQLNPWPLLVSMTSLLVSVSFALGSSVSKYVEGIFLIAVRRPFDLGDRIVINPTESADSPGATLGWFVEDITLSSTTLRFGKSNEVATVSNYALSQSKIVNFQRSPLAIVFFKIKLHSKIMEGDKLKTLVQSMKDYVRVHPRVWDSMLFWRLDDFGEITTIPGPNNLMDADYRFVVVSLCFQHRVSWQSAPRVTIDRGELIRHIYEVCLQLGVQYDQPAARRLLVEPQGGVGFGLTSVNATQGQQSSSVPGADPSKLFS